MSERPTRTVGRDGIERWEDGTPVSPGNAFTQAYGGQRVDVKTMATNARSSEIHSQRIAKEVAKGNNPGKIYGLSRKSDERTRPSNPLAIATANALAKEVAPR